MPDKKTILVLTSRFPYPLEKGDKLRAYHQIKALSKKYNIVLCSLTNTSIKSEWIKELTPFCVDINVFKLSKAKKILNLSINFFTQKPFQVAYFYQRSIQKQILEIINKTKIDAIYCQLIRMAEYVKDIHDVPKTIDFMDVLSEGMFKRAKIAKGVKKILFKVEGKRLKMYENKIFDYFNHHTIISEQDKNKIYHPQNNDIIIVPNGVDDYFLNYSCETIKEYDIVFVGNLSYPPNIESCLYILNFIVPFFNTKGRDVKVLLSGANPSPKILKLAKLNSSVVVSGWVDDIRSSYCKGKVFVAPLFIGTGLQNKILEAMALKIPCVSTTLVNNALKAEVNKEILIANNVEEFYLNIIALIDNEKHRENITSSAKNFVKLKYNWQKTIDEIPII